MSETAIAVIVATYKRPHLIERALDSIARQTLPPREIVVVDDASGDETGAVVSAWADRNAITVTFIAAATNGGVAVARNLGMAAATSPLIAFLDSDDEYLPTALEQLAKPFATRPRTAVSFADAMQHWHDGTASRPMMRSCLAAGVDTTPLEDGLHQVNDPSATLLLTTMIPTCAALFRRDAAAAVGWIPAYRHGEDWLFWLKLTGQGPFLCQFVDVAIVHRQGDNLTGIEHGAAHAQEILRAMIALRDGTLGIALSAAENVRLDRAIVLQAWYLRYHSSRRGLRDYWRAIGSAEGRATGGRPRHLLRDPKSLLRATWFSRR